MRLFEITSPSKYFYHVTLSKNVPSIMQNGLQPLHTSNWVKGNGERYNEEGGVFAFEDAVDAFKWAFNMNWEFKQPVSIVRIRPSDTWEIDPSEDIMLQSGNGRALRSTAMIPPSDIVDSFSMDDFSNPAELGVTQQEWFSRINKTLSENKSHGIRYERDNAPKSYSAGPIKGPSTGKDPAVIAYDGKKRIGYIILKPINDSASFVEYIVVAPEYRRQGIGRNLYIEAAKWLAEQGKRLHASAKQSPAARKIWKTFDRGWDKDLTYTPASPYLASPSKRYVKIPENTDREIFKKSLATGKSAEEIQIADKVDALEDKYGKFGFSFSYNYGRFLKAENKVAVSFRNEHHNEISIPVYKKFVNDIAQDIKQLFNTNNTEWKNAAISKNGNIPNYWVHCVVKLKESANQSNKLPPKVAEAFIAIADEQRGEPEHAMLRVQHVMGGGVLSPVVEHVGDIEHRMTEHADVGMYLEDIVREKVERGLRYLTHPYGFEREMQENIRANNTDVDKLDKLLVEYGNAHSRLPAYNAAHYWAREAAMSVGYQDWEGAIEYLGILKKMLDEGKYKDIASSYHLDGAGKLLQYTP